MKKDKLPKGCFFVLLKKIRGVLIWILFFTIITSGIFHILPFNLNKDITIFITDEGRKIGLFAIIHLILGITGAIFMFKGYIYYREKHWHFFDDANVINRDKIIYDLEKMLNLSGQIELIINKSKGDDWRSNVWRLEEHKWKMDEIIEIVERKKREKL